MTIKAKQIQCKGVSAARNIAVDFIDQLDAGEVLTGTPTVTEVTTSDLTLSNKIINTAELTINDRTVAIGKAVQCKVTGGTAYRTYKIKISVGTNSTPAQTLIAIIELRIEAET